ncbi:MAG: hypothetical protein ABSF90_15580 [Syntrophobacteraceae bacterium]|jgi:hypothetical protein
MISFEFPGGFSRDPVDTARRLEIARTERCPLRNGELWNLDRWNAEIDKALREGMGNQTQGGTSGGIESGSGSPLEKPSNKSSETNAEPSEDPGKIIEFCNVGFDTTETVSDVDDSRISSQYTHPLAAIMLKVKDPLTGPDCGFIVFGKRWSRHRF